MPDSFSQRPTGTEVAKRAWNSTIAAMRAIPMLFISAGLGAVFVVAVMATTLAFGAPPSSPNIVAGLVKIVALSALGAPVAVAIHRFILMGETSAAFSYAPAHTRRFFLWLFGFELAGNLLDTAGRLNPLFAILAFIAFVLMSVNLAMIFPAIAIDVPHQDWQSRIRQSWEQMQGHFWLFIRSAILAYLPLLGVWILFTAPLAILALLARATGVAPLTWLAGLWVSVAAGPMMIFAIAVGAAVASWLYLWVRDPQAQSAQTATSTVT